MHKRATTARSSTDEAMGTLEFYEKFLRERTQSFLRIPPLELRSDDIVIAGHPKSGTTWLMQIVHQIRTGGDENFQDIYDVIPYLTEAAFEKKLIDHFTPRTFKTHALYEKLIKGDGRPRFIVCFRDPYDSEFSFMKFFWRRYVSLDQDMTTAEYIRVMDSWPLPDFANFIAGWYRHQQDPNFLFIAYEDLKRNLAESVQKISKFLLHTPVHESTLAKVLYFCSFEYMSENRHKFKDQVRMSPLKEETIEAEPVLCTMVRPGGGRVGQGKARLDEAAKEFIDKRWKDIIESEYGFKNYKQFYNHCTHFPSQ